MKGYKNIYKFFYKVSEVVSVVASVAALLIIVLTTIDVILRIISKTSPDINMYVKGNYELTQMLMIPLICLAYALTEMDNGHVKVALITEKMGPKGKLISTCITNFLAFAMCGFLFYSCIMQNIVHVSGKLETSVLFIPFAPFSIIMTVGIGLFAICLLLKFINSIIIITHKDKDWEKQLPGSE